MPGPDAVCIFPKKYSTCSANDLQGSVCVCVIIPFILDVRYVDVPAGVEEGHTGFLHLPSAVLPSIFLARRIQPFFSLVNREVEFCVLTI